MAKNLKHRLFRRRNILISLIALIVIAAVLAVLEVTNTTHIFHDETPVAQVVVKKGKPAPEPQKNVSNSNSTNAEKTPTTGNSVPGGATDTNGSAGAQTSPGQWIVAASGAITVKQPLANAALQSGDTLSGSAKVSTVNFRLIDNQVGVISQGTLNVVNGNFSGNLNFTSHSSTGRLDVFSTDDQGVEINEVQISVSFK